MGKKKGSKKKGSGKKTKKAAGSGSSLTQAGPTQIELSLRLELQRLENDVQAAKWEVEDARNQNEFLHDEIRRTTEENNEYEKYISKKTTEEQAHVANLVDKNQHEIDAIEVSEKRARDLIQKHPKSQRLRRSVVNSFLRLLVCVYFALFSWWSLWVVPIIS
eukprot:m.956845 g.956845  ORF g.956845 m.956845 type:complete len:162 (-) comp23875_c1_seq9:3175-3660(-)